MLCLALLSFYYQLAPPHSTIPTLDYFKYIDPDQSDPVRLRQLLVWTAEQVKVSDKHVEKNVKPLLKKVVANVLQGLVSREINTSWYHRPVRKNNNKYNTFDTFDIQ